MVDVVKEYLPKENPGTYGSWLFPEDIGGKGEKGHRHVSIAYPHETCEKRQPLYLKRPGSI